MIDLEKIIAKEVEKQLLNRGIASRASVSAKINEHIEHHHAVAGLATEDEAKAMKRQIKKLFALSKNLPELTEEYYACVAARIFVIPDLLISPREIAITKRARAYFLKEQQTFKI